VEQANNAIAQAIEALPNGLVYRGAVNYYKDLPTTNNELGDTYSVKYQGETGTTADGNEYAWGEYDGTLQWIKLGVNAYTKDEIDEQREAIESDILNEKTARENLRNELQEQINNIVLESSESGDVTAEVIQARVGTDGVNHATLKERLDAGETKTNELKETLINTNTVNLFNPDDATEGAYWENGIAKTNSAFSYIFIPVEVGKTYTATGSSYMCFYLGSNYETLANIVECSYSAGVSPLTFTVSNTNCRYVVLNYRHANFPTNSYMFVEGTELPTDYINYGSYKLNSGVKLSQSQIIETAYYVGATRKYTSLMGLFEELKDDDSNKTIYVDSGVYNIFEEIGGYEFINSIPDGSTNWRTYSIFVPKNTKVIGVGRVILEWLPTETVNDTALYMLSPINVGDGNAHLENITIKCTKCRYGIHDQTKGEESNCYHTYKNVNIFKDDATGNYGNVQAFGCGFNNGYKYDFDSCVFKSYRQPFSMHNELKAFSSVIIRNCIFDMYGTSSENYGWFTVRFGNTDYNQSEVQIKISNSYIRNKVAIVNESATVERPNAYNLTMLNNKGETALKVYSATNIFEPLMYGNENNTVTQETYTS
jgi:hypothetical protein